MNLRGFLNAVYTLFVESSIALGKDVFSALEEMKALGEPAPVTANGTAAPAPRVNEAAQNDASLMQLMGQLKGSSFGG
jgi:hypothetical protein